MKIAVLLFLFCLAVGVGWSNEEPMPLSLNEALRIAFEKSPDLKATEARLEVARGLENEARSNGGLQLTASGLLMDSSTMTMIPTNYDPMTMFMVPTGFRSGGSAVAALPLFTGGKISQTIASATASHEAEKFRFQEARLQLAYAIKSSYFQTLAAEGQVAVARDEVNENLEMVRRTDLLLQAGKVPAVELLRAKSELSESKRKSIEAQNAFQLKKVDLVRLIGLNPETEIRLTDMLQEGVSVIPSLNVLLTEAKAKRPELLAEAKEVAAREAAVKAARGEYAPQLYAYGRADTLSGSPGQFNGSSVGVVASFPLFDSGRRSSRILEAEGRLHEAQEQAESLNLEISRQVIEAQLNLNTAMSLLEEAHDAVAGANEDLRIMRLRFENGKAIQLELFDTVTADTRAKLRELQARSAYQTALANLDRAVGKNP